MPELDFRETLRKERVVMRYFMLTVLCCSVCSTGFAQDTYVDYNRSLDFRDYHTYAWGQQPNPNQIKSPFLAQEAQNQIDMQLQSRGLKLVSEDQNPDLIVVASGGMKQETSYTAWGTGGWRFGAGMASITPDVTVIGTLVVDLYLTRARQLVWRGVAQGALNESKAEKNRRLVDKGVAKMFKKYPVQPPKQ
jgi:Domain of unknown function (DUF4136)